MRQWQTTLERWRAWPVAIRWAVVASALVCLGVLVLLAVVPRMARSAMVERGQSRGLKVDVARASLGLGRIWLGEILIEDPSLPGTQAQLGALEIQFGLRGLNAVRLHGAQVRVAGSRAALEERWRSLERRTTPVGARSGARARRWTFEARGIDLHWNDGEGRNLYVWGAAMNESRADPLHAQIDLLRASQGQDSAELRALEIEGIRAPQAAISRFEAARGWVRLRLDPDPEPAHPKAVGKAAGAQPGLVQPLREVLRSRLAASFFGRLVALDVQITRAEEALRIGPSQLTLTREGDTVTLEVAAHPQADSGTPLGLKARLPLQGRRAELEVTGGPVSLAALGVQEGDFGLIGVRDAKLAAQATVTWDFGNEASQGDLQVTSRGRIENARLLRPALAADELSGIGLGWRFTARAEPGAGRLSVKSAELSLGEVRAEVGGELEQSPARTQIQLKAQVPLTSCSALLEALPYGAVPLLSGMKMAGTFALSAQVQFDSSDPKAAEAKLDVRNECRIPSVPAAISPERFRKPWTREVQGIRGPMQLDSGPGTPDWTAYEDISPYMETAVLVCEDEGFFRHRGFAWRAIESSIEQNLMEGRFFRGGSTVSMQLAKNLYLGREKTLARKIQEAALTLLLEQELSKHELMELYLNVIEYGPGIYGIRQAARYYFNEEPGNLSLGQALYLGSILPKPDSHHFMADGRVSAKWSAYLRKLMQIAYKIRRISEEELAEGLSEQVAFRQPNLLGQELQTVDEADERAPAAPELR